VNHTIDTVDLDEDIDSHQDNAEMGEMKSKPNFTIDIIRGNEILCFTCSFNSQLGASGADESYSMYNSYSSYNSYNSYNGYSYI